MKKKLLITGIILSLLLVTAVSATLLSTVKVPATVTINSSPDLAVYAPDCSTPLTTLNFNSIAPGSATWAELCLMPKGSEPTVWLASNFWTSTLPTTTGTLTLKIIQQQGNNVLVPPIGLVPGNPGSIMYLNFTMKTLATALNGTVPFSININGYSTAGG